jgi:hypothetical protein
MTLSIPNTTSRITRMIKLIMLSLVNRCSIQDLILKI